MGAILWQGTQWEVTQVGVNTSAGAKGDLLKSSDKLCMLGHPVSMVTNQVQERKVKLILASFPQYTGPWSQPLYKGHHL